MDKLNILWTTGNKATVINMLALTKYLKSGEPVLTI